MAVCLRAVKSGVVCDKLASAVYSRGIRRCI